jgi:hypothetical protein
MSRDPCKHRRRICSALTQHSHHRRAASGACHRCGCHWKCQQHSQSELSPKPLSEHHGLLHLPGRSQECKTMGMTMVTPEHICLALCKSQKTSALRLMHACAFYVWTGAVYTCCCRTCRKDEAHMQRTTIGARNHRSLQPRVLDRPLWMCCQCLASMGLRQGGESICRLNIDTQAVRAECLRRIKDGTGAAAGPAKATVRACSLQQLAN